MNQKPQREATFQNTWCKNANDITIRYQNYANGTNRKLQRSETYRLLSPWTPQ